MVNLLDIVDNIDLEEKVDSVLINPYSKMGTEEDWTEATRPGYIKKLTKEQLETLSLEPALNRICTAYADSAILKGWEFTFGRDGDIELAQKINDLALELEVANAMNEAQFLANVYGGAAIIQFIDDGRPPDQPINYQKIRAVKGYRVLDRYKIRPDYKGFEDPKRVEHYEIMLPEYLSGELKKIDRNRFERGYYVHRDRILRFDGTRCTPDLMRYNGGWSFSLIEQIYDKFQRYETSLSSSGALLKDYSLFVLKMKGWADKVQTMEEKEKAETQRQLTTLYRTASIYGGMIIDQDEHTLEFPKRDFGSISDISNSHRDAFIGASGLPHTKLFGESPSGLGATGESEERTWAHEVGAFQVSNWLPKLNKIYKAILASAEQKRASKVKKSWSIKFHSVLQLSEEEILSNRATQAQTDSTYVVNQILTPEEVRESRFGGSEYSIETILERKAWDKFQQQQQGFGGEANYFGESDSAPNSPPEEQTLRTYQAAEPSSAVLSSLEEKLSQQFDSADKAHRIIEYQGLNCDDREDSSRIDSGQKTLDTVERINLARSDRAQDIVGDWLEIIEGWLKSKNTLQEIRDGEIELYQLLPQKKFQTLIEEGNTIAELAGRTEDVR